MKQSLIIIFSLSLTYCLIWIFILVSGGFFMDLSFKIQDYFWDYKMPKTETRRWLNVNAIYCDVYNLKGVKGPPNFHGDSYVNIFFNFKNKDLKSLTNNLVNSWKNNKRHQGLTWNELSKWETLNTTRKINFGKTIFILPQGSLIYVSKYQWIGIDTNSMKCVYHEFFP